VLTSLPLLKNIVDDLEAARNHGQSSLTLYFTKESHIHTLMNLILAALPMANRRIPELDYAVRALASVYHGTISRYR
jgi:inositol hexakisphosphate/diphosphoinositol-pentakisphosphate kinase